MAANAWDGKGKGSTAGNRFFMALIRRLGPLPAYPFLVFPCLYYTLFDRQATAAIRSLRSHLGLTTSLFDRFRHFYSFGASLVDRMAFLLAPRPPFGFTCLHEELIVGAVNGGRGVILLNAHMGNWEIAGSLLVDRIQTPVNAIMLDAEREELQRVYRPALEQRRFNTIPVTVDGLETMLRSAECLRRGEILSLAGDRVLDQKSESLEFLGGAARFPRGPFAIAAITGAPIIPVFTLKTGIGRYTFEAHEPIVLGSTERSSRDARITDAMKQYVRVLERAVREHPYQWYNFFDFWGL